MSLIHSFFFLVLATGTTLADSGNASSNESSVLMSVVDAPLRLPEPGYVCPELHTFSVILNRNTTDVCRNVHSIVAQLCASLTHQCKCDAIRINTADCVRRGEWTACICPKDRRFMLQHTTSVTLEIQHDGNWSFTGWPPWVLEVDALHHTPRNVLWNVLTIGLSIFFLYVVVHGAALLYCRYRGYKKLRPPPPDDIHGPT